MNDNTTNTASATACHLDGKCYLDSDSYRTRKAHIQTLMERALLSRERHATSVLLRFRSGSVVKRELDEIIALERECCPFLTFTLHTSPDALLLTISGSERASVLLDDAFSNYGC
jgi:hypothetical protein